MVLHWVDPIRRFQTGERGGWGEEEGGFKEAGGSNESDLSKESDLAGDWWILIGGEGRKYDDLVDFITPVILT